MPLSKYDRKNFEAILFGEGDWFTAQLIRLVAKADLSNRDLLRKGFPAEVSAEEWQRRPYSPSLPVEG